jgi:hypothetical protein
MPDDGKAWGHTPFTCAPGLKIEAQERLSALQFKQLGEAVTRLEVMVDRLEKRLWLAVYGVAAAVLAEAGYSILKMTHLGGG